jgi:hypothetical protein
VMHRSGARTITFALVFAVAIIGAAIYNNNRAANKLAAMPRAETAVLPPPPAPICPPDRSAEVEALRGELTALRNAVELTIAIKPEPGKLRAAVNALAVYLPAK